MRASRFLSAFPVERGFERNAVGSRPQRVEVTVLEIRQRLLRTIRRTLDGSTPLAVPTARNGVLFCLCFRGRRLMSDVMRELEVDFPGEEFHHALFQALPVPVLVVDKDLDLWEYNASAARTLVPAKPRKE